MPILRLLVLDRSEPFLQEGHAKPQLLTPSRAAYVPRYMYLLGSWAEGIDIHAHDACLHEAGVRVGIHVAPDLLLLIPTILAILKSFTLLAFSPL